MYANLVSLSRGTKRSILLFVDSFLVVFSTYCAFALRYGDPMPTEHLRDAWPLLMTFTPLAIAVVYSAGMHRIKLHSVETRAILRIATATGAIVLIAVAISYIMGRVAPRSVPLILGMVFFVTATVWRLVGLAFLNFLGQRGFTLAPVAVYGAGAAGAQLVSALRQSREVQPVVFVDDNPALWGLIVSGLKVESPNALPGMVGNGKIEKVLLAIPSLSAGRQQTIVSNLSGLGCEVQALPSYIDLIAGRGTVTNLRTVTPDDLLGRDKVDLDIPDVAKAYAGRVLMVTGAGGSIGSELCRQLVGTKPSKIVLFERNEFALYQIDRDLRQMAEKAGIPVVSRLGSVTDARRVRGVMAEEKVAIVLHAAAYKHVPIVEENELEGARNNVMGTQVVAEAAMDAGCERFILISTDKAVRPTNIMGATKRMAELVIQDLQTRSKRTIFAMVRFGNVLGSSGSVLPLFERQIRSGGPVTVTHPEVTRFFMTIPEAARLVLLAGAYAEGGDVFVLDMGQPIKITEVARRMIELSGQTVRENGIGDIEITFTGLRPGEKLYEELLIDDDSLRHTPHPKIMRAQEERLSQIEVASMMRELSDAVTRGDVPALRRLVQDRVAGYHQPQVAMAGE